MVFATSETNSVVFAQVLNTVRENRMFWLAENFMMAGKRADEATLLRTMYNNALFLLLLALFI